MTQSNNGRTSSSHPTNANRAATAFAFDNRSVATEATPITSNRTSRRQDEPQDGTFSAIRVVQVHDELRQERQRYSEALRQIEEQRRLLDEATEQEQRRHRSRIQFLENELVTAEQRYQPGRDSDYWLENTVPTNPDVAQRNRRLTDRQRQSIRDRVRRWAEQRYRR